MTPGSLSHWPRLCEGPAARRSSATVRRRVTGRNVPTLGSGGAALGGCVGNRHPGGGPGARISYAPEDVPPVRPGQPEGFNNPNHATRRYSWIKPPSTFLRSTGVRLVLRTCG